MATLRASNAEALYLAQTKGSRIGTVRGDEANADLNCIKTVITLEGDEAVGGVIELTAPLREGQVPVAALSHVVVASAAGTLTANIGTKSAPTGLASAANLGGAGVRELGTADTDLETFKTNEPLQAVITAATGLTAGKEITLYIVTRSI